MRMSQLEQKQATNTQHPIHNKLYYSKVVHRNQIIFKHLQVIYYLHRNGTGPSWMTTI